jgi:hypothetical protein
MKKHLITLLATLAAASAFAAPVPAQSASTSPYTKIEFFGLNCTLCEDGLKDKFEKLPTVSKASIDMNTFTVCVRNKSGREISDKEIKSTLAAAGFNTVKVEPVTQC